MPNESNPKDAAAPVRILQVEDVETDAELILRELKRHGLAVDSKRVWTEAAFVEALTTFVPQVILSDCKMPTFDGLKALAVARERAPDAAFVFVSGSMRPEDAANALSKGAYDYLVKDDLTSLGPTVE